MRCLPGAGALPLVLVTLTPFARADVRLPAVFGPHMVLQRDAPVPVWGWADADEEVTVEFAGQHHVAKANKDGHWKVELAPLRTGGTHTLVVRGKNELRLDDVLVGEVWVCSGQSNMEFRVKQANQPRQEIANADYPKIRLFKVPRLATPEPKHDCKAHWVLCSPATIPEFSAVGYFFGRELHRHTHVGLDRVPIGLISSSWGGTRVEAWTSKAAIDRCDAARPLIAQWNKTLARWPEAKKQHAKKLAQWKTMKNGHRPRRPRPPSGPNHRHRPSNLFNGMIAPLIPFAIRGAIWYQGESNASRARQYRSLFPTMIRDWRTRWGRGDFPFLFVQLANFKVRQPKTWAELREAQTMALSLPNTGMAVTIDIGNPRNIHPRNKQEVGRRLSLWARTLVSGEQLVFSGPLYRSSKVDGDTMRIEFDHIGTGLHALGGALTGFQLAGADHKFHPARAKIHGKQVLVSCEAVPKPIAVRYGWSDNPHCSLYNSEHLPASPFRTDDW